MIRRITPTPRVLILMMLTVAAAMVWMMPSHGSANEFRPNLQICVQNLDGTPASRRNVGIITAAFNQVKLHPSFSEAKLDRGVGPAIVAGCPGRATILSSTWSGPKYGASDTMTETPSAFHTFVFVIPQTVADQMFGTMYPRTTTQETVCMDHVCGEISTAVYVTPEELNNVDTLVRSLLWGVGLVPSGEEIFHTDMSDHTHKD